MQFNKITIDATVKSPGFVTPANAGVQNFLKTLDSGVRRNDGKKRFPTFIETTIIMFCLVLFPTAGFCASTSALVDKGIAAYQAGKYDDALKAYEEAGVDAPESPQIYFNKGAAYYRKGDYAKAKEAWEKAALNSKDISLEAKATFNLGDTAFQEAQRHKDSNLQKSLDACKESIGYYQQAIDLLKNSQNQDDAALKKDASENLEMVRLDMKSILDALQKQQEEQKKQQQQQTADDLKKRIDRQQELNNGNQQAGEGRQEKQEKQKGENKNQESASKKKQDQEKSGSRQNAQNVQNQDQKPGQQQDTAESILDEEKENLKDRQPAASGGYQGVDKDW